GAAHEASVGRGRLFSIRGEAGIGKTRIVEELIANVSGRAWRVLVGRAYESDQVLPFGPWVDALKAGRIDRERDIVETSGAVTSGSKRESTAPDAPPLSGEADYRQLFESVAQVIERLARLDA